jgi:regulator of protease activity HflC (stomatin/prohibitin superfamily)
MERRAPEVEVAEAIDRVLAAESEAAAAIAAAGLEAEAVIEVARARRRQILETARRRATRLHTRAQERLRQDLEALGGGEPAQETDLGTLRALSRTAVENLASRLTSDDHGPP